MTERAMPDAESLRAKLRAIDGRSYPAYKSIKGSYRINGDVELIIDRVQGDPFAAPSQLRARVALALAGFGENLYSNRSRAVALRDYLARAFAARCRERSERIGSGGGGRLEIDRPGQEILERSSIVLGEGYVEARFAAGLPASGRRILGREAARLLLDSLPQVVAASLRLAALEEAALWRHVAANEDADALRATLRDRGWVAFVADGAVLPRRSGVDPRPLDAAEAVPFASPDDLRAEVDLPHAGRVSGMVLREGVTLIVGGGYHGKTTLLAAIEEGVCNHVPGDGRERVVADAAALKIRAEDGRSAASVNVRPFIRQLPGGRDTARFSTANASGSSSQAANIQEGLEAGARALLLDEDTCATNLMVRDARMQALVARAGEPIAPFIEHVRYLADERGVSSVMVFGGSGDYFDVADCVLRLQDYRAHDVTREARAVARRLPTERASEPPDCWPGDEPGRVPDPASLDPSKGKRAVRVRSRALRAIEFGSEEIDLSCVEQLVDAGQVRAIGRGLVLLRELARREREAPPDIATLLAQIEARLDAEGLDALAERHPSGGFVRFRPLELAAALNRLRTLRILPPGGPG